MPVEASDFRSLCYTHLLSEPLGLHLSGWHLYVLQLIDWWSSLYLFGSFVAMARKCSLLPLRSFASPSSMDVMLSRSFLIVDVHALGD